MRRGSDAQSRADRADRAEFPDEGYIRARARMRGNGKTALSALSALLWGYPLGRSPPLPCLRNIHNIMQYQRGSGGGGGRNSGRWVLHTGPGFRSQCEENLKGGIET